MSKQDVIRFIGSLFLAGLILNASLMILSISWGTIFISNVALVIYIVFRNIENRSV